MKNLRSSRFGNSGTETIFPYHKWVHKEIIHTKSHITTCQVVCKYPVFFVRKLRNKPVGSLEVLTNYWDYVHTYFWFNTITDTLAIHNSSVPGRVVGDIQSSNLSSNFLHKPLSKIQISNRIYGEQKKVFGNKIFMAFQMSQKFSVIFSILELLSIKFGFLIVS